MNSVKTRKIISPSILSKIIYRKNLCDTCKHYRTRHTEARGFEEYVMHCKRCMYCYSNVSHYEKYKEDKHHG